MCQKRCSTSYFRIKIFFHSYFYLYRIFGLFIYGTLGFVNIMHSANKKKSLDKKVFISTNLFLYNLFTNSILLCFFICDFTTIQRPKHIYIIGTCKVNSQVQIKPSKLSSTVRIKVSLINFTNYLFLASGHCLANYQHKF